MLKIETSKGVLDLGGELTLQVEEKSPVMNERGSQSLPATVPATARNLLITGFPHRLDGVDAPMGDDKSCVVSDGVYHRRGIINLVSASRREGITFNVGFDNSEAYEAWKKRRLNELALPMMGDGTVSYLKGLLQAAYSNGGGDDFAVFPVAVEREEVTTGNTKTTYWGLLNRVENGVLVSDARSQQQPVDGTMMNVSLPDGYGVTGFLYVWRVLELAFGDLGYEIEVNPFKGAAAGDLSQVVVLNNVADAICTGWLKYSDLLPDCEVQAFLQALKVRFGLVYLLNQDTRRVRLELVRDIIAKSPGLDITPWQAEWPLVSYEARKQLKLSAKTSLPDAAPVNERLEDYTKGMKIAEMTVVDERAPGDGISSTLQLERWTGKVYKWDSQNLAYTDSVSGWFDWDPQTEGVETEELSSEDECVPMMRIDDAYYPGYITGAVHRHSYIKGREGEKEENETPLAFVISYGQRGRITPPGDAQGERLSLLFQWNDGLYARFWSGYDDMLRRSFNKVEVTTRMNAAQLLGLDLLQPVKYQGQALLIDGFDYMLPMDHSIEVAMTLRTMRSVGDVASGQSVPIIGPSTQLWNWVLWRSDLDQQVSQDYQRVKELYPTANEPTVTGRDAWRTDEYFLVRPTGPEQVQRTYEAHLAYENCLEYDEQGRPIYFTYYTDVQFTVIIVAEFG